MRSLGVCSASATEEWAVVNGLQLAWDLGFRKLIMKSDASEVINMILDISCISCSNLVLKARELLSFNWQVDIRVISREFNRVADALAKKGIACSTIFVECPSFLRNWVDSECLGFVSPSM